MKAAVLASAVLIVTGIAWTQDAPLKSAHAKAEGIPPRAAPADYQAHTQAGSVSIGAEFAGHFVPTPEGTLTTDDFVVVETGLFGEAGARLTLSPDQFSLRVNGKKVATPSQPAVMVSESLKDPDAEPPSTSKGSKTSIGGGGGPRDSGPPPPVHVPIEVRRTWTERVQKASLAEGDRPLPQAGLLFFPYKGKTKGIHSLELIYSGPAGQATLELQP